MTLTSLSIDAERRARLAAVISDPVAFSAAILRHEPWAIPRQILRAVAEPRSKTAVKSCHASSKTFTAAEAVLWFVTRYHDGKVVTTAPTMSQVKELLWREIHMARNGSRIDIPDPDKVQLDISPERFALGRASSEGVNFQGFHGRVLVVIDEAPGVDNAEVWAAIEGIRAGGDVRVLALGNPTIASGPFYDLFNEQREGWNLITISAFDTPNLAGLSLDDVLGMSDAELDDNERPYLITRRFVREKYHDWGPGHMDWQSRVLGQFPDQSSDALISLAWLEAAAKRPIAPEHTAKTLKAGIDVAGPGEDETVLCVRDGADVLCLQAWPDKEPYGRVVAALEPYRERLVDVNVDTAGIGEGIYLHLKSLGFPAQRVNVGESPRDKERFANLKAELYWGLRMRFADGDINGLTDRKAQAQLASILWEQNPRGQTVIESKEHARKRGVKSPDLAEAIMLAFADAGPGFLSWMRKDAEKRKLNT